MSRETLTIPQGAGTALRDFALDVQQLTDAHSVRLANLEAKSRQDIRQTGGGFARWPWGTWTIATNTQLPDGAACRTHLVNCTSASNLTLPTCKHGDWIVIVNAGTATLTIKDGGTTLCTLPTDTLCFIKAYTTSAFAPQWPTKVETWKRDGTLNLGSLTASRLVVTDSSGALASNAALVNTGVVYATGAGGVISAATLTYVDPLLTAFANNLTTTVVAAMTVNNSTAATSGVVEQYSPAIDWIGHSWKSGIGASDRTVRFRAEVRTATSATTPVGTFALRSSVDTGTASWTDRLTLTSAGLLTVSAIVASASITNSALTATRVVYSGTAGLQVDSANMTFDGSQLALAATGSSGGVLIGGDTQLYRSAANNLVCADNFQVAPPNNTTTSGSLYAISTTYTAAPSANTSGRTFGLLFSAVGSTNNNYTDSTSGILGMEGGATHSGSGTVTAMSGGIFNTQSSSTGTITTCNGIYVLGWDGSSGATATTYNGVRSDGPRLSGAGAVTTAYCFVCHPRTVSTGTVKTLVGAGIFPSGNMNAHNANNQVRLGVDIGAMPSPGAFTGTTTAAIRIQGTGGSRDAILFSDARLYRSAASILSADSGFTCLHATNGLGYGTGAGGTVTQATSKSTGVTLNKVCGQITMNGAALAAGASVSFTLTNSTIAATDTVNLNIGSAASADSYNVMVTAVAAGSCRIQVQNFSAGSLSEALVLNFAVIKAVTS